MSRLVVDGFGGPGGWAEGLRSLGIAEVGIEIDPWACATRAAAGHRTIRTDISTYPIAPFLGRIWGAVFSPPCTDYSRAGKRAGRTGDTGKLVEEVVRWVGDLRPEWVVCEQVPDVLPIWREFAHLFARWGYSTWCGELDAADYGVPQNRKRAILMASRTHQVQPPAPTHTQRPHPVMFGSELPRWVSMADALDICPTDRVGFPRRDDTGTSPDGYRERDWRYGCQPSQTVTETIRSWVLDRRTNSKDGRGGMVPSVTVPMDRPAPTVVSGVLGQWLLKDDGEQRTLRAHEALVLQGFRPDYPVQGNRSQVAEQVANAVPPPLAARIVAAAAGIDMAEAAA